jgi:uncharacterized membrane protein YhaH (DUF805 family)
MAYSDSTGDNAGLLKRTVTAVADFSGRSRRTEVIYYWIATTLVGVVFYFAVSTVASLKASLLFANALQLVLLVPMFALFARRLHDQDRSGWWGLLLPLSVLLGIPDVVAELRGDMAEIIAAKTTPVGLAAGLCGLIVFVLCLLPGTQGANRYGQDPRLEEV